MPEFVVITTTSLRTRYVVEADDAWEARRLVNDDEKRADLIGYPAGFEDDERVGDVTRKGEPAHDD